MFQVFVGDRGTTYKPSSSLYKPFWFSHCRSLARAVVPPPPCIEIYKLQPASGFSPNSRLKNFIFWSPIFRTVPLSSASRSFFNCCFQAPIRISSACFACSFVSASLANGWSTTLLILLSAAFKKERNDSTALLSSATLTQTKQSEIKQYANVRRVLDISPWNIKSRN